MYDALLKKYTSSVEMPKYTRRKRGGGLFDFLSRKPNQANIMQQVSSLEAQRNAAVKKSKSRVANFLSKPGEVVYTNKNRIRQEFHQKIENLMMQIQQPEQSKSALETLSSGLESALKSQSARETGAIVLTIPIGVAQLAVKVLRIFLAVFALFIGMGSAFFGSEGAVSELVGMAAPNTNFTTTRTAYNWARKKTGASGSQLYAS
jgi:hypothetical protein